VAEVVGSPDLDQRFPTLEAGGSNLGRADFANGPGQAGGDERPGRERASRDHLDASPLDAGCSFFFIDCFDRIVSQFL
jgi:hypothetical protein